MRRRAPRTVKPIHVLVIDDEEIVHLSLRRLLEKRGFAVACARTPQEGLLLARCRSWGLIILDLLMPAMDGIQVLRALELHESTSPVLVITGYPTIENSVQALRCGVVDVVPKPFTNHEILSAIDRSLA